MEREEDKEYTAEEEEIGDMLLSLALSGNPDATFGWAGAREYEGFDGWGSDFPKSSRVVKEFENGEEESVPKDEEEWDALDIDNDDGCVTDNSDNPYYDPEYPCNEEGSLSHAKTEIKEQSLDYAIPAVTSEEGRIASEEEEKLTLEQSAELLLLIAQSDEYEVIVRKREMPIVDNNDSRLASDPHYEQNNEEEEEEEEDVSGFWTERPIRYFLPSSQPVYHFQDPETGHKYWDECDCEECYQDCLLQNNGVTPQELKELYAMENPPE